MQVINVTEARANIFKLMDQIADQHEPVMVMGKRNNVVMISEEEWRGIQETIYLSGVPGMVEFIKEVKEAPAEEWIDINEVEW